MIERQTLGHYRGQQVRLVALCDVPRRHHRRICLHDVVLPDGSVLDHLWVHHSHALEGYRPGTQLRLTVEGTVISYLKGVGAPGRRVQRSEDALGLSYGLERVTIITIEEVEDEHVVDSGHALGTQDDPAQESQTL